MNSEKEISFTLNSLFLPEIFYTTRFVVYTTSFVVSTTNFVLCTTNFVVENPAA